MTFAGQPPASQPTITDHCQGSRRWPFLYQFRPNKQVVEVLEFETTDPNLRGEMRIVTTLAAVRGGTEVSVAHDGIPRGVSTVDNETGTRMVLANLAALVESNAVPSTRL